jgi:hypothetical protein
MSLGYGAARQAGNDRRAARRQAALSIQDTMRVNSRLTLLQRSLPGFAGDPNLLTELATSTMDDSQMMQTGLDIAGDSYMMGQVEDLQRMDDQVGEAYFLSYASEMQTALRGAGYTPASEQGGGIKGFLTSALGVPFSGRAKQLINKGSRLLPGVESGPFDNQSNVDMSFNALPNIVGKPLQGVAIAAGYPFRVIGKGLDAVMWVGDQSMEVMNRIVQTGALMNDRQLVKGYDEHGRPIYSDDLGGFAAKSANMNAGAIGHSAAGWIRGLFSPSELRRAWGDSNDGEDLFQGEGIRAAAAALSVDEHGSSTPGSKLWLARRRASGMSMGEMIEESGLTPDQPEFLESVQRFSEIMQTPEFEEALDELAKHRISYGDHATRQAGIDPTSTLGQITTTGSNLAFTVIADPLNLVGVGFAKYRKLARWKVAANASDHKAVIGQVREYSDWVRHQDAAASGKKAKGLAGETQDASGIAAPTGDRANVPAGFGETRTTHWFSEQRLMQGANVRQARRTNAKMDRLAEAWKRYDDALPADKEGQLARLIDENQDLLENSQTMLDHHIKERAAGREGLSTLDGQWAYFADELGRKAIVQTGIGGVRSDIRVLPQWTISDKFIQHTKAFFRDVTDPAAGTLRKAPREYEYITDVRETMTKIGAAEEAGTLEIAHRSLIERLKSRRLTITIDGKEAPLDVDELLNWTLDTKGGSMRRFVRGLATHSPTNNTLALSPDASVKEMRRFFDMGAMSHMSQKTIDEYVGAFMHGHGTGAREALVKDFVADLFYRSGIANYADGAAEEFYKKWTRHFDQAYASGGRDAVVRSGRVSKAAIFVQSQGDDVIQIPNITEFARATRSMNAHRMMFGVFNPNYVDKFIRGVWAPLQLMRIGFIPRAAGEEMMSWMLREGPMKAIRAGTTNAAAGVRRSRHTGELILNSQHRELASMRWMSWTVHQMSDWAGVGGKRLAMTANTRAMKHQNWSVMTDAQKSAEIRKQAELFRSEHKMRNSLSHLDRWVENLSHRGAEWGHHIQKNTRGIPSKQGIATKMASLGQRPLQGNVGQVFKTQLDLRIYAMRQMAVNSRTSRAIADIAGGMVEPYMLQADSVLNGSNSLGTAVKSSRNGIIPLRVDVSKFKMYARTQDETEFLMAFSQQMNRFMHEDSVRAGVAKLHQYSGTGSQLRFSNYLDDAPLEHTRVFVDDSLDRVNEARTLAKDELANIEDEILRLTEDQALVSDLDAWKLTEPEAHDRMIELQEMAADVEMRIERLKSHSTLEGNHQRLSQEADAWVDTKVQSIEDDLNYIYAHLGEGQPLPHAVQQQVDGIASDLARKIRLREVSGPSKPVARASTKGGYSSKGRGTPAGDAKDAAMREAADGAIVETVPGKTTGSSQTTLAELGQATPSSKVVMLARNGGRRGQALTDETRAAIKKAIDQNPDVRFVVGDMPGVDQQFVELLDELGANYTVYHGGTNPRFALSDEALTPRTPAGPNDVELLDAQIKAGREEINELREMYGIRELELDEITRLRDELARVQTTPHEFDEYKQIADELAEAQLGLDEFDELQLGPRSVGPMEGDELVNPEGLDRVEAFRTKWNELPYDERIMIQAVIDGEVSASNAIQQGIDTPLGQWIANNHERIEMREWAALSETATGTGVVTSREQIQEEILNAVEASLRSLHSDTVGESVRAVLDEAGRMAKGPSRGHRFTYTPMIDATDADMLVQLGSNAQLRVQYKRLLHERLLNLGLDEKAADRVVGEVLNSWSPAAEFGEDAAQGILQAGDRFRKNPNADPSLVPATFFSHPDSRVAQAISESVTDLSTTRTPGARRPTFGEVEVPKDKLGIDTANHWGAYDVSGGTMLQESRLANLRVVDNSKMVPMQIVEHPELGRRLISSEPEEGWRVVGEVVSDGSTYDEGIRRLAMTQTEEIIDNLTNFRRGGDDVLHEITAPLINGEGWKLTADKIRTRAGGGAVDLPQHVYGPSIIPPSDLMPGNLWEAIKRGAFDEVISPAINALVRQPMFLDKFADAIEMNWDLRLMFGPSDDLIQRFNKVVPPTGDKFLDDMVEMLWESEHKMFGVELLEGDVVRADFITALQKGNIEEMVRLSDELPELGHLTNDQAEIVRQMAWAKRRGYEQMIETSTSQAMNGVVPFIDDHRVRSQFQNHVGGMMPFWFAEEQFMKRWARGFYQTPHMLHKGQLTMHGFKEMGFVQTDADGRSVLVWPMSQYAAQLVAGVATKTPIFGEGAGMVLSQPLATDINFLFPGVNENAPEGMQFGPGVAWGLNFATTHFPEFAPARDQILGDMSANRWDPNDTAASAFFGHFIPSTYRNLYKAVVDDSDAAALGSAQVQAMQYLIANGHEPDETNPFEQEEFIERTRETARVILLMRGLTSFGLGSSASPLLDNEAGAEFRDLLNAGVGFPDAVDMITAQFGGDATAYTVFASSSASGAPVPSTAPALEFMQNNGEFLQGFDMAAPWFLPQERPEGEYGILETRARNQALAHELRMQRSPEETLRAIYMAQAAPEYFDSRDVYTQQRLTLKAQGQDEMVAELDTNWRRWKGTYLAQHPIFNQEINTPEGKIRRDATVDQIRVLVASPELIPEVAHRAELIELMQGLASFTDAMDSISGERSGYARDLRDQWRREFYIGAERFVAENPALSVFFNSVIRPVIGTDNIAEIEFTP